MPDCPQATAVSVMKTYSRQRPSCLIGQEGTPKLDESVDDSNNGTASLTEKGLKKRKITDYFSTKLREEYDLNFNKRTSSVTTQNSDNTLSSGCSGGKQTFLDLGQKDFFMKTCKECGFAYDPSFEEDEKAHKKYHRSYFVCFQGEKYLDSDGCIMWIDTNPKPRQKPDVILRFTATRFLSIRHSIDLIGRVNEMMSAVEQDSTEISRLTYYLYLGENPKKVIGIMFVEEPSVVSRIWVDERQRRRGIAMRLLQNLRRCDPKDHLHYCSCSDQCYARSDEVAFSAPTQAGLKLAQKFCGGDKVIIM